MGNAVNSADAVGAADADLLLAEGLTARVRVPGSSANLGPGFDCLGVALGVYDEVSVTVTAPGSGVTVTVEGESSDDVPRDGSHLVARAVIRGFEAAGVRAPGVALHCVNVIPHSRGLGSSAAAVVGGLAAASALVAADGRAPGLTQTRLVQLSSEFEGHPDNAAASVLGGAVVTWSHDGVDEYFARRLDLHPAIVVTSFVPQTQSSTSETRGLLPDAVPRGDAVFNLSRAALGVVALTSDPTCLFDATADRLHQPYRAQAMPATSGLVAALRDRGHAATVSGAGPSVLVLGAAELGDEEAALAAEFGFAMIAMPIADGVEVLS